MIVMQAFLRGGAMLAIAALLTMALSRRSAALRHHIWASAIMIQLALLWLISALPEIPLGLPLPPVSSVFNVAAATPPPLPAASVMSAPAARHGAQILMYVWLGGGALILLRYLIGTLLMARTARYGRRIDDGAWLSLAQRVAKELAITRPVTLLWGDRLVVPVTWGVLYPMVLLPASARDWPPEERRLVLLHELAHVKRFDALTQLVAQITLAVFWFSPFVWLGEWRLRVEREYACDDVVLHHGTDASLYADQLLRMVRALIAEGSAQPAFAALAMARRSQFEGRMRAILDPARARGSASITSGLLFILLSLCIAAPVAAVDLFVADSTRPTAAVQAQRGTSWVEQGLSSIGSSGDLKAALTAQLASADKPTLLMLARVSRNITSSADKSSFLTDAVPHMLGQSDADLETAWFDAVSSISSSYNRAGTLMAALPLASGHGEMRDRIAEAATHLGETERAKLLIRLAAVR
jgi:beta-lactamase regulating signal transducer with metallopeptidase domain